MSLGRVRKRPWGSGAAGNWGKKGKDQERARAPANRELLRRRNLGTTFGKRQQEKWFNHLLADASRPGPLTEHQSSPVPREPARGSHTAIFKTDKNRACPSSALSLHTRGLLRLAPTSCCDHAAAAGAQAFWASSPAGVGAGGTGPLGLSSLLNGNAPPSLDPA